MVYICGSLMSTWDKTAVEKLSVFYKETQKLNCRIVWNSKSLETLVPTNKKTIRNTLLEDLYSWQNTGKSGKTQNNSVCCLQKERERFVYSKCIKICMEGVRDISKKAISSGEEKKTLWWAVYRELYCISNDLFL